MSPGLGFFKSQKKIAFKQNTQGIIYLSSFSILLSQTTSRGVSGCSPAEYQGGELWDMKAQLQLETISGFAPEFEEQHCCCLKFKMEIESK